MWLDRSRRRERLQRVFGGEQDSSMKWAFDAITTIKKWSFNASG
jgi:hypothetical protein